MVVWVMLAGAAGATGRYAVHRAMESRVVSILPWGTIAVNVVGSLALGVVAGLVLAHGVDPDVQVIIGTGFLGAFTTFSAFSYETFALLEDGASRAALLNGLGSVVAGLLAATVGLAVVGAL